MKEPCPYDLKPGRLSSHGRILEQLICLPRDRRILDVGTATGYLGRALRELGFRRLCGLEANASWAEQARAHYESLVVGALPSCQWPWPDHSFDMVLCADVLEHLAQPHEALRRLIRLVSRDGGLIVSLPNVAHWSVRLTLLFGRFPYGPAGILDSSHLRFFTLKSGLALLRECGLSVERRLCVPLPVDRLCRGGPAELVLRAFERADYSLACLLPGLFAYQFLFFCRPSRDLATLRAGREAVARLAPRSPRDT